MACVANRSTTVRKAIRPITRLRRSDAGGVRSAMDGRRRWACGQRGHRAVPQLVEARGAPRRAASRRVTGGAMDGGRAGSHHVCVCRRSCSRSAESSTAVVLPVFFHQCEVPVPLGATSPALCTIGTAQLLAYSVTSPSTT